VFSPTKGGALSEDGGAGKNPIWELDVADLGDELIYREDPLTPGVPGLSSRCCRRRSMP
jgi:hypothetical protein